MPQFRIDTDSNAIVRLARRTFGELGFKERSNLQEWIAKQPSCLDEELLVVQKEFAGFSDTHERLDLLALDKKGSLVLIENKLDDTGRDVTWQALKYASYCSRLSKDDVRSIFQEFLNNIEPGADAQKKMAEFFDDDYEDITINQGMTPRIILIAANFRKEVTSTVLWLLTFKLQIQCFRVEPYSMGDQHFINIEQIIPTQDIEKFMIGIAEKTEEVEGTTNRHRVRREFWAKVIQAISGKTNLFQNASPSTQNWINAGSGMSGVVYGLAATRTYARAELYIDRGDYDENLFIYNQLRGHKDAIENAFGGQLIWESMEGKRACRIKAEQSGNIFVYEQWPTMIDFMIGAIVRLENALKQQLATINSELRNKEKAGSPPGVVASVADTVGC